MLHGSATMRMLRLPKRIALFVLGAAALSPPAAAQLLSPRLYVNADAMSEGSGTAASPCMTLNAALAKAWVLSHPGGGIVVTVDIFVQSSTTPIAPLNNGGKEATGWQKPGESTTHKPFPIRMIDSVNIIGVARLGVKPVVMIDEFNYPDYDSGTIGWDPSLPRALFIAASSCTLKGLKLDGTKYVQSKVSQENLCVSAEDVMSFTADNCEMVDLHDGIRFWANPGHHTTGTVTGGRYADFFPVGPGPGAIDAGHAAIWLQGEGELTITVSGATFEGSHDAIEIAGTTVGSNSTIADLSVIECVFHANENGVEVAGTGALEFSAMGSTFDSNQNLPGGYDPTIASMSAIVVGGMNVIGLVRDNAFVNNAYGVFWRPWEAGTSSLDMGQDSTSTAGHNVFQAFDSTKLADQTNLFRVHVYNKALSLATGFISAARNTWIPNDLGASATGCLINPIPGTPVSGPVNVIGGQPPGPFQTTAGVRNYAILNPVGKIDFGGTCTP